MKIARVLMLLTRLFTDCDTSDDLSNGSKAQVGTLKLDLPVDEDDYLMPSPANDEVDHKRRHAPANYIDLIGHQHAAEGEEIAFR